MKDHKRFLHLWSYLFYSIMYIKSLLLLFTGFMFMQAIPAGKKNQPFTTKLQVTVRDELGNIVEGAEIRLFKTEEDYNKEENQVGQTLKTDSKGRASFNELEPVMYYIIAEKDDLSNSDAGTKTGTLEAKKINRVTIIIS